MQKNFETNVLAAPAKTRARKTESSPSLDFRPRQEMNEAPEGRWERIVISKHCAWYPSRFESSPSPAAKSHRRADDNPGRSRERICRSWSHAASYPCRSESRPASATTSGREANDECAIQRERVGLSTRLSPGRNRQEVRPSTVHGSKALSDYQAENGFHVPIERIFFIAQQEPAEVLPKHRVQSKRLTPHE